MKIANLVFCLLAFAALALPVLRPQDVYNPLPPHVTTSTTTLR
jgi:hypothetical protein